MRRNLFLMLMFIALSIAGVKAQVRIGDTAEPTKGAVLDLNNTGGYVGGLLLPKVNSLNLTSISEFSSEPTAAIDLIGLIVYNTDPTPGLEGIYIWTGSVEGWKPIWKKN